MVRACLYFFAALSIIAAPPLIATLTYYYARYLPYQTNVEQLLAQSDPAHRQVPKDLIKLAYGAPQAKKIHYFVAKNVLRELDFAQIKLLFWNMDRSAWTLLLKLHFSPREIITLWCNYIVIDGHRGLNAIANARFHKNLNGLSIRETATLVVIAQAPAAIRQDRQRIFYRVNALLDAMGWAGQ